MNYKFKGTPGPWQVLTKEDNPHLIECGRASYNGVRDKRIGFLDSKELVGFGITGCMLIEDARLMAAAPDLFEALKETAIDLKILKEGLAKLAERNHAAEGYPEVVQKWIDRAESALKKSLNIQQ